MTMRNRKTVIVAFMVAAVLLMAVGFAALTDTLTIIGNAHVDMATAENTFDEKIYFSEATAVSSTGTGSTADTASYTPDDATFTVNKLAVVGQQSIFKFIIENDSNVDAAITVPATKLSGADNNTNSNPTYFEIEYTYATFEDDGTANSENMVIPSQGYMEITVVVTIIKPVTSATSAMFSIEYTATTVDP
jgi:hypothetical protein